MTDSALITGRLVYGHPMKRYAVKDRAGQPKLNKNGEPQMQISFGVAVPKNGATDFKQTDFGKAIEAVAVAAYPNGEHRSPHFAWKITDGDSTVPNKKGIAPVSREGYPGHFVVNCSTQLAGVNCYHVGHYQPHEQIQSENDIKTGDYCSVYITFSSNNNKDNPGVYINPIHFVRTAPGEAIVSEASGPAAAEVFAGLQAPEGASTAPPPPATPQAPAAAPPPPPPHNPLPKRYLVNGVEYTADQLKPLGWTDEQLAAAEVK